MKSTQLCTNAVKARAELPGVQGTAEDIRIDVQLIETQGCGSLVNRVWGDKLLFFCSESQL